MTLTVSMGVEMVRVPNIVDHKTSMQGGDIPDVVRSVAIDYADNYGLRCVVTFGGSSWQSPAAGAMVPKGSTVHVHLDAPLWAGQ